MKYFALIAGIALTSLAGADEITEPDLKPDTRSEIESFLRRFRDDGTISPTQFGESIDFLNGKRCDGISRKLTPREKSQFSLAISGSSKFQGAEISESFEYKSWQILFVSFPDSEPAYLFYSSDPRTSQPVTIWGGVNAVFEGPDLVQWTLSNAPAIPKQLAECFSWHVTFNRGQW